MLVMIDNYDSFTYNLVQYFGELKQDVQVFLNDQINIEAIKKLKPTHIVISPGPCTPLEAGISNQVILEFQDTVPILGVCLGHQCIGHVFGGKVIRAKRLMHGKISAIHHHGKDIFKNIPNPFNATRYHSLIVEKNNLPDCLEILAETDQEEIMALRHKSKRIWGVQFHPESILTQHGKDILKNFLEL